MNPETSLPTCYRHPDRETRLSCTACERPICVECMQSASVGQKCPECAKPEGRNRVISADEIRAAQTKAPVAYTLIGISVAIFVVSFIGQRTSPETIALVYSYAAQANFRVSAGEWWRLFTSMFFHDRFMLLHILFNMYALYLFGPPLEREVGPWAFGSLYFACGLAGGAAYYIDFLVTGNPIPAVGASGAIFGLFGAWLAASWRNRHTLQGRANLNTLLILLAINGVIGFVFPGIAWQAHLGGLIAGFVILLLWMPLGDKPGASRKRTMITLSVAVLALGLVIVL